VIPGLNCSPSHHTVCNSGYHFRDQYNQNNHTRSDSPGKPKNS
jgi:hypothetical protein